MLPPSTEALKQRILKRGQESPEALETRVGNAVKEIETLMAEKAIFMFRVVNDRLDVAKRTILLLTQGLYSEELTGKSTQAIIDEMPF